MKATFALSALLIGLSFATFAAEAPAEKLKVRTLQTKTGKRIRTKNQQIVKVKQSGFHKSLG